MSSSSPGGSLSLNRFKKPPSNGYENCPTLWVHHIILIQLCWRKWAKQENKKANTILVEISYNTLVDKYYDLTVNLSKFIDHIKLGDDATYRILIINHAIALKETGQTDIMEELITKYDWSACSLRFIIALYALRNNFDKINELLPKAFASEQLSKEDLENWPLFNSYRKSEGFYSTLNSLVP